MLYRAIFAAMAIATVAFAPIVALGATGDTVVVRTITYDSTGRTGYFQFPDSDGTSYERVILQYRMKCYGAKTRQQSSDTVGCGEWDYNCETFITDSSRTDSLKTDTGYVRLPQKFEIMSFVTPYGIGLDLGAEGRLWEFDVTDYLPILHGGRRLSIERGAWQEQMDLRFLFIKGTPARKPIQIQQVWPMTEEGYQTILQDKRYEPRTFNFDPNAASYKLRAMITGHGQEGEFLTREHFVAIGQQKFQWEVFKNCSDNPLYPQGGTWIYRRAGWCPGAPTELKEFALSNAPGSQESIDYSVTTASGDSRYDPSIQVVSYAAPSFTKDAAVVAVKRPSDRLEYLRLNPACDAPIVVIQNNGSDDLTAARIEYYVDGGPHQTYEWSGALKFLDTLSVVLPIDDQSFWGTATGGVFHVDVTAAGDEYDPDGHYSSNYVLAPKYQGTIVINLKTNAAPGDNYYSVFDHNGQSVMDRDAFDANTTYYDSLMLPVGCYTFKLTDDGEDGLYFWNNAGQGQGSLRLRQSIKNGKILKTFIADFGAYTQYDFAITQSPLAVNDPQKIKRVRLYPNPAVHELHVELDGYTPQMVTLEIFDATGRSVKREQRFITAEEHLRAAIDISHLPKAAYHLRMTSTDGTSEQGFVVE
jgi:hypothetical protein